MITVSPKHKDDLEVAILLAKDVLEDVHEWTDADRLTKEQLDRLDVPYRVTKDADPVDTKHGKHDQQSHGRGGGSSSKSVKEAEQWAIDNKIADEVDYSGFSIDQANSINAAFDTVRSKTSMDVKVRGIRAFKKGESSGQMASASGDVIRIDPAMFNTDTIQSSFPESDTKRIKRRLSRLKKRSEEEGSDPSLKEKITRYEKRLAEAENRPRWAVIESKEDVIIHELGHKAHNLMMQSDRYGTDFLIPSELRKRGIKYEDTLGSKIETIARSEGVKLSEYATTHGGEYMAEAFTSIVKGEKNRVNKDVASVIQRMMK